MQQYDVFCLRISKILIQFHHHLPLPTSLLWGPPLILNAVQKP